MHFRTLSALALSIGSALAGLDTQNSLKTISKATTDFHEKIAAWDGSYLGAVPVLMQSRGLMSTLNTALSPKAIISARSEEHSDEIEAETLDIARALEIEIGNAVDTAIGMKPLIEGIPIAGKRVGLMIFRGLHSAASSLGTEFSPRASEGKREEAQGIVDGINAHLLRGLAAYENEVEEIEESE
jgi:hypothetical protein